MTPALRFDGPARAAVTIALAHGAGAPMDDPFLESIATGLAARGLRVARFEFPYMDARRKTGKRTGPDRQSVLLDTWRAVVATLGGGTQLVIGGKSMGGRMASLVADEVGVRGLVCLGYPFHPVQRPGGLARGKPAQLRIAHLAALRTPTLIVQGERDPFGTPRDVAGYRLSGSIRIHWIADGDHSLVPRKASGRTRAQNLGEAVAAVGGFLDSL